MEPSMENEHKSRKVKRNSLENHRLEENGRVCFHQTHLNIEERNRSGGNGPADVSSS
ncbi:hypothetical protein YC2023_091170 [Brassica napus]